MLRKAITVNDVVDFLNEVFKLDPEAAHNLVINRVPCNDALVNHPSIQVAASEDGENARVGLLGLLNGLCGTIDLEDGTTGYGPISAVFDDDGKLTGFSLNNGV